MSMNKDNSHSWVRISHCLNKLVTNLNNNDQETSEVQFEEYALKLNAGDFASRSKAKAKPQRKNLPAHPQELYLLGRELGLILNHKKYSLSDYPVSKKLIHLLRHGQHVHRDNDGAIEFWRLKDNLQNHFLFCHHWSDEKWNNSMAGGGQKKRFQCYSCEWINGQKPHLI